MAKYTIRIKEILENYYGMPKSDVPSFEGTTLDGDVFTNPFDTSYKSPFEREKIPTPDEVIEATWSKIFDFQFPKIKDFEVGELEQAILKAYYMREIGLETIARFKLALNQRLNQIMPYYIDLYESKKLVGDNPLENYDLHDTSNRDTDSKGTSEGSGKSNTNANNKAILEDTPSSELDPSDNYATTITTNNSNEDSTSSNNTSSTNNVNDKYQRDVHGIMGYSKQDLLYRYRENIINIKDLIIGDLADLFMSIY